MVEPVQEKPPLQFSIRMLLLAPAILAICIFLYQAATAGRVSRHQLNQLRDGMTKDEVLNVLGKPYYTKDLNSNEWRYGCRHTSVFIGFEGNPPLLNRDLEWWGW